MSGVRFLARNIFRYGGFCLMACPGVLGKKVRLGQRVSSKQYVHQAVRADGTDSALISPHWGNLDPRTFSKRLTPGFIYYATSFKNINSYNFIYSINRYLAFPPGYPNAGRERFLSEIVMNEQGMMLPFNRVAPDFKKSFPDERIAVRIFWAAYTDPVKTGYEYLTYASLLMPDSYCNSFFDMLKNDPRDFHNLMLTLFPAYELFYPTLRLGLVVIKGENITDHITSGERLSLNTHRYSPDVMPVEIDLTS